MHLNTSILVAIDATWPAAKYNRTDGWLLRDGAGGGKRVSAASRMGATADINVPLDWFAQRKQRALFMLTKDDYSLDQELAARDFAIIDPVVILGADLAGLNGTNLPLHTQPTDQMRRIWGAGGVDPARLDVMARAAGPKGYFEVSGKATAFAAIHNTIAMAHAVEVLENARRSGLARYLMAGIVNWARANGARELMVLTVRANHPALQLYQTMGLTPRANYHYRLAPLADE